MFFIAKDSTGTYLFSKQPVRNENNLLMGDERITVGEDILSCMVDEIRNNILSLGIKDKPLEFFLVPMPDISKIIKK